MKRYPILFSLVVFTACTTVKNGAVPKEAAAIVEAGCPKSGSCSVSVHKNSALTIKTDDQGKLAYEMIADNSKSVIVYSYTRSVPEGVQDGNYREDIVLEADNPANPAQISDLQNAKILFGRFCYCKGYTGYYKIERGTLKIEARNKATYFQLDFKVREVPQILESIRFLLK